MSYEKDIKKALSNLQKMIDYQEKYCYFDGLNINAFIEIFNCKSKLFQIETKTRNHCGHRVPTECGGIRISDNEGNLLVVITPITDKRFSNVNLSYPQYNPLPINIFGGHLVGDLQAFPMWWESYMQEAFKKKDIELRLIRSVARDVCDYKRIQRTYDKWEHKPPMTLGSFVANKYADVNVVYYEDNVFIKLDPVEYISDAIKYNTEQDKPEESESWLSKLKRVFSFKS